MSIQSDVEILSICVLEDYARLHHLSENDAVDLFHKYQVFEKIILQHEYLHQLDYSETVKYVEDIMAQKSSVLVLYHGTNIAFEHIDLSKSHNRRDFGRGFYCTILEKQAQEWAHRLYMRNFSGGEYVYQYVFHQTDDLKIKHFNALDMEWLEFIKCNRIKGGIQHSYDVVIGPVADDNTMETVQLYMAGILKGDEAVERLRYNKVNNQVSFHTPLALKRLQFECRKEVTHG
ncbi:DUF3990 domain-containing protein [Marvinbryantia sp.]|uniref:DUF3990 domain-containing protein n=1 Tax=Marvinbryantia sp. TaxID=2496532 RepID=UPI0025F439D6|nr:DUF3990 domain-containing protein [uncultured Marvinbryantia sp.]